MAMINRCQGVTNVGKIIGIGYAKVWQTSSTTVCMSSSNGDDDTLHECYERYQRLQWGYGEGWEEPSSQKAGRHLISLFQISKPLSDAGQNAHPVRLNPTLTVPIHLPALSPTTAVHQPHLLGILCLLHPPLRSMVTIYIYRHGARRFI